MPLYQHIKSRHGESEPCLKILPDPVHDLFEMADHGEHRQHRLDEPAVIPLSPPTQFEVGGIALRRMAGGITRDNPLLFERPNEGLKRLVRDIGRGTLPSHPQSPLGQPQTSWAADNPAVMGEAFATDLPGAPAFADRVDQRDAIGLDAPEPRRRRQAGIGPRLRGHEEAKEPGPLG